MAATASQDAAPAEDPMDDSRDWLDASWVVLPAEALPGLPGEPRAGERRFVLLHPAHGIAILDLWSSVAALPELEVAASLETELALAGFLRRQDPRLPVRRIYLTQAALPQLTGVVARAYAGTPPLDLPEGWIDAVRGRLAVPQKPTSLRRMPRLRMAGRYRLAAGIAALLTAGVVGLLAAGGHVVGQRAEPGAEARSAPATTLTAAVPAPAPAEPALTPATPPPAAGAGPLAASTAIAPPAAVAPPAAMPPDPARLAAAPWSAEPALSPATPARAAIVPTVAVEPLPAVTPDAARIAAAPTFSPATPQPAASPGPLAASAAIAPPPAWAPAPVMPPDPAHAAEGPTYGPAAAPPRSVRQHPRPVRRAASARSSRGQTLNSSGSFIRQQSLQYATGNGS